MIKSSGYRISPTEIEEVAAEVAGVVESAVVGLADESLGHRVALALVVKPDAPPSLAEQVRQYCREQLPPYMVPAEVHVLDALPRNVNGKCDRAAVAAVLARLESPASRDTLAALGVRR
jgi:acyl-coenzyme A synthetase/AMP-(fatty) acid ligase